MVPNTPSQHPRETHLTPHTQKCHSLQPTHAHLTLKKRLKKKLNVHITLLGLILGAVTNYFSEQDTWRHEQGLALNLH